jgi:hypothetical protein
MLPHLVFLDLSLWDLILVKDVLDLLAAGVSEKEILEDYPDLEAEDVSVRNSLVLFA